MVRHSGVWALVALGALVVVVVVGVAAKIGMDTSRYLETVSEQRDWTVPGREDTQTATTGMQPVGTVGEVAVEAP